MRNSPSELTPLLPFTQVTQTFATADPVQVLHGRADRVALVFAANFEAGTLLPSFNKFMISLSPFADMDTETGIVLSLESPTLVLDYRTVGSLVVAEWYAATNALGATLTAIETRYTINRRMRKNRSR